MLAINLHNKASDVPKSTQHEIYVSSRPIVWALKCKRRAKCTRSFQSVLYEFAISVGFFVVVALVKWILSDVILHILQIHYMLLYFCVYFWLKIDFSLSG